jgi:hypothetical protein
MNKKTRRLTTPGMEHLEVDDKGKIVGLYCLDTDKLDGIDSWDAIDQAIKEYAVIHPNEIQLQIIQNAEIRNQQYNKFGSGESKAMRHGVSLPVALMFKLERIMPDLFQDQKKLRHFMKKYKGFRTCQEV